MIKNFLFPDICALCGVDLVETKEIHYGLCNQCRPTIITEDYEKCNVCGKPLISEIDICTSCRNDKEKPYDKLWVLYPYTGKYRELLTEYKFRKKLPLAEFFAEKVLQVMFKEIELTVASIVPVPPRPFKIKHSGWDQVEYLVKCMKKLNGDLSVSRCLKRRKSQIQKQLSREERIKNLKGRIYCVGNVPKIALLIDDVITTGSTMEVCAAALKEAGAEKVYGLCLFYD